MSGIAIILLVTIGALLLLLLGVLLSRVIRQRPQPQQPQLQPPSMRQQQTDTVRQHRVEMEEKVEDLENLIFEEDELRWNRQRYDRLWQQRCQTNSQPPPQP